MRRRAAGNTARARGEVRPLENLEGIMPPHPSWRSSPLLVAATFDENLCTDSVLPGSVAPGPVTPQSGFCGHFSPRSVFRSAGWGRSLPFPPRTSILTGLCFLADRLCPRIEGSISCIRPGISLAECPGVSRRRPFHTAFFSGAYGISEKTLFRALVHQGFARTQRRVPNCENSVRFAGALS